jgi:hypothetical protein
VATVKYFKMIYELLGDAETLYFPDKSLDNATRRGKQRLELLGDATFIGVQEVPKEEYDAAHTYQVLILNEEGEE